MEIFLYDEIGSGQLTAKRFTDQLAAAKGQHVTVRINSPGGSVFEGVGMYNALARYQGGSTVEIDGLAASIASVIAMGGRRIRMAENALLMVHSASSAISGNAADLRKLAATLDAVEAQLVTVYRGRTGLPAAELQAMLAAETWMDAQQALALRFIDEISEPLRAVARFDLSRFKRPPTPRLAEARRARMALLQAGGAHGDP